MKQEDAGIDESSHQKRCEICNLVARNQLELEDHIKNAHRQGGSNAQQLLSEEQKIDPFIDTQ
jgi:hypothetical protein